MPLASTISPGEYHNCTIETLNFKNLNIQPRPGAGEQPVKHEGAVTSEANTGKGNCGGVAYEIAFTGDL